MKRWLQNLVTDDDDDLGWLDIVKSVYWHAIPSDYRPGRLWYRLKCFVWYRYTTVKPKTLDFHTWCDRDHLLVHCMFQILVDFVEKEIDYDFEHKNQHSIEINGEKRGVGDIFKQLYDYWKEFSDIDSLEEHDEWWEHHKEHSELKHIELGEDTILGGKAYETVIEYDSEEAEQRDHELLMKSRDAEIVAYAKQEEMMHLLVKIHRFMWT